MYVGVFIRMPQFNNDYKSNYVKGRDNWSASRISTYRQCPLKYYYTYVKKWRCSKAPDDEAARKGTVIHETVEKYYTGEPKDKVFARLEEKAKEYNIDLEKYDERSGIERFFLFWDEFVAKRELTGFKVIQEGWVSGDCGGERFVGALDLCLDRGDKVIIFDYKSGKTPSISKYKEQLLLYAYLRGQERGWDFEQTAENVKLYLFFPMSEQKTAVTPEDKMLASVKEVKYDANNLRDCINEYLKTIREIQAHNWEEEDLDALGCPDFVCKWCEHQGGNPNSDGYKGCKASRDLGHTQERFVTYHLKESN